jgi:chromate reductase, NAD(P)H dehydrogenase (quinone)
VLTLIVGTNRPGSNTRRVAKNLEATYAALGVPLHVLDLAQLPAEIFSPTSYAEKPKSFAPFSDAILRAEGLIVVTPEYNGSVPGVLKYFIDMLKFPESFEQRPVCFVGLAAGMWGALRPVEQLQAIFGYRKFIPSAFSFRASATCSTPMADSPMRNWPAGCESRRKASLILSND